MSASYTPFAYSHIAAASTTVVRTGPGFLYAITVNSTVNSIITIYDDVSAVAANVIGILKANVAEQTFFFECAVSRGITVVTAGNSDITVAYA